MAKEFSMDVLHSDMPMSGALHKTTSFEFGELRDQLGQLWTQGFINPDTLPSDAPVLFIEKEDNRTWVCMDYAHPKNR